LTFHVQGSAFILTSLPLSPDSEELSLDAMLQSLGSSNAQRKENRILTRRKQIAMVENDGFRLETDWASFQADIIPCYGWSWAMHIQD
jgi:hypothetical protein